MTDTAAVSAIASGLLNPDEAPEPVVRDLRLAAAVHRAVTGEPGNTRVDRFPAFRARDDVRDLPDSRFEYARVTDLADKADGVTRDHASMASAAEEASLGEDDVIEAQGRIQGVLGRLSSLRPALSTDPMSPAPLEPRDSEKMDIEDAAGALLDPLGTLEDARRSGRLSPVARAALQEFYPGLFSEAVMRQVDRIASGKVKGSLGARVAAADVAGVNTFGGTSEDLAFFQNVYAVGESVDPESIPPPPPGKSAYSESLKPASEQSEL